MLIGHNQPTLSLKKSFQSIKNMRTTKYLGHHHYHHYHHHNYYLTRSNMQIRTLNSTCVCKNLLFEYKCFKWKLCQSFHHSMKFSTNLSFANMSSTNALGDTSSKGRKNELHVETLTSRLLKGDRGALSKSITLVESKLFSDHEKAQQLLTKIQCEFNKSEKVDKSFRIGISGPPGVGKSTFIESFGRMLTQKGYKVAVIAVDPSSSRTGGSILGDKTRMIELSRDPNAYIRPCPSQGYLGGVTANTFEIISLCECAQYDIIIIETVGVGQSETQIVDLTDLVLLLVPPGGGDELQGIKRGIVEIADLVVVTKADGSLLETAKRTKLDYKNALHLMQPISKYWTPKVMLCSSKDLSKVENVWSTMQDFQNVMKQCGEFSRKRSLQRKTWMWKQVSEELLKRLLHHEEVENDLKKIEERVQNGQITPRMAADEILHLYVTTFSQSVPLPSSHPTKV